jgi:polyribonucleotide nucleotidyltransferase
MSDDGEGRGDRDHGLRREGGERQGGGDEGPAPEFAPAFLTGDSED